MAAQLSERYKAFALKGLLTSRWQEGRAKTGEPIKFLPISLPKQFAKRNGTIRDIRDNEAPVREATMALPAGM